MKTSFWHRKSLNYLKKINLHINYIDIYGDSQEKMMTPQKVLIHSFPEEYVIGIPSGVIKILILTRLKRIPEPPVDICC